MQQFEVLSLEFRQNVLPRANEMLVLLRSLLKGYHEVRMALLGETTETQYPDAVDDMNAQLGFLLYPGFLTEVNATQLQHYPRYLEGMLMRIERLQQDPGRDARRQDLLQGFSDDYFARTEALDDYPAALDAFHWLLEEYRVSVFAQPLKTALPISPKRLKSAWRKVPEPS